jgi:hypothetical protein
MQAWKYVTGGWPNDHIVPSATLQGSTTVTRSQCWMSLLGCDADFDWSECEEESALSVTISRPTHRREEVSARAHSSSPACEISAASPG